ncbi:MAG TPA: glycosyltransferase, partial [Aggregatilineales bacterium]|nr:glycosyltransferase [Aggregatilineales bacterium]
WNPHIYAFYERDFIPNAVDAYRLHTPISSGRMDIRPPMRLAREFRQQKTVIAWALAQGISAAWGRLGAMLAGVPIRVLSIHDSAPLTFSARLLTPWTDAIVTNSRASAEKIERQGIPEHKLHILYNGIDTEKYAPALDSENRRGELFDIPPERPVILNIGRLFHEKGRDIMLRAAVPLMQRDNPPLVVFAGEGRGSQRAELEQLARDLGIAAHVRFPGIRNDVPDLLRAADIVVMSSRDVEFGESCPNVILEGMASALPVIGTRVGGTAELILEGETGLVIPPEDPAALTSALETLLDNPDLRIRIGRAGRKRIETAFTIARMVQGREDLFLRLLNQKKLPVP